MLTEKLVDDYPMADLEDFLSVTDYSKTLSADYYEEWMAEGWLGRLANSVINTVYFRLSMAFK